MRWWIWPPAILLILFFVFDFADNQLAAGITILLASGIWLVVGCIKGTQGPNEYGPDTLGPSLKKASYNLGASPSAPLTPRFGRAPMRPAFKIGEIQSLFTLL
jgi:hypothetical protein